MEKPCYAEKTRIKEINPETLGHSYFTIIGGKREGMNIFHLFGDFKIMS